MGSTLSLEKHCSCTVLFSQVFKRVGFYHDDKEMQRNSLFYDDEEIKPAGLLSEQEILTLLNDSKSKMNHISYM